MAQSAQAGRADATASRSYLLPIVFDRPVLDRHDDRPSHRQTIVGQETDRKEIGAHENDAQAICLPESRDANDAPVALRSPTPPRPAGEGPGKNQSVARRPETALPDPYVASGDGSLPAQFFTVTMTPRRLLTAREAADYCGIAVKQLRTVIGISPVELPNGKQLFDIHDLDGFIEGCKSPSAAFSDDDILARL